VVAQVQGGFDKKEGAAHGHRPDTIPICNEIIKHGWRSFPIFYSDEHEALFRELVFGEGVDGMIVRINPSEVEGVTNRKWEAITDECGECKRVMSTARVMLQVRADLA
jgi:hypothetical protein